jgi:23S rRNA pseudouridine2605 synthase
MAVPDQGMRLNRYLARAGQGSRRSVEEFILAGRVTVNGETVRDLGRRVDPATDQVTFDGKPLRMPEDYRVYAFHKPLEVVSTLVSQGGQPSLLPYRLQSDIPDRFVPVGRLDAESSGLLLWTDDGELNQRLCRPDSSVWKTYEIELNAPLPPTKVEDLTKGGLLLDGRPCRPCRLAMQPDATTRHWVMELHEGRRRQIRRMFNTLGLKVLRLHRTAVGPVRLGKLRPGDFRRLGHDEVEALRQAVTGGKSGRPKQARVKKEGR